MRALRNESEKLSKENRSMTETLKSTICFLQTQMMTTVAIALDKKQELERKLEDAHKSIYELTEKVAILEGS